MQNHSRTQIATPDTKRSGTESTDRAAHRTRAHRTQQTHPLRASDTPKQANATLQTTLGCTRKRASKRPAGLRWCGGCDGSGGGPDGGAARVDGSRAVHRLRCPRREGVRGGDARLLASYTVPSRSARQLTYGHSDFPPGICGSGILELRDVER